MKKHLFLSLLLLSPLTFSSYCRQFDRRGPNNQGPMTGRGCGPCNKKNSTNQKKYQGYARGKGFGRGRGLGQGQNRYCSNCWNNDNNSNN